MPQEDPFIPTYEGGAFAPTNLSEMEAQRRADAMMPPETPETSGGSYQMDVVTTPQLPSFEAIPSTTGTVSPPSATDLMAAPATDEFKYTYGQGPAVAPMPERYLSDDEALDLYNTKLQPGVPKAERDAAAEKIQKYIERRDRIKWQQDDEFLGVGFTDPEEMKRRARNPTAKNYMAHALDQNNAAARLQNWAYLEHALGVKIHSDLEYEILRDHFSDSIDGVPTPTDASFFAKRGEYFKKQQEMTKAEDEVYGQALDEVSKSLAAGNRPTVTGEAINAARSKYPELFKTEEDDMRVTNMLRARLGEASGFLMKYPQQVGTIRTLSEKAMVHGAGALTDQEYHALGAAIQSIPEGDQDRMISAVATGLKSAFPEITKDKMFTFWDEMAKEAWRGLPPVSENAKQGMLNNVTQTLQAGGKLMYAPDGREVIARPGEPVDPRWREATPEQTAERLREAQRAERMMNTVRRSKHITETVFDPSRFASAEDSWWRYPEKMARFTAGQAGFIGTQALSTLIGGPVAGAATSALGLAFITQQQKLNDLLVAHPDMDFDSAAKISTVYAAASAPFDWLEMELSIPLGPLKGFLMLVNKGTTGRMVVKFAGDLALRGLTENLTENVQNAIENYTDAYASALESGASVKYARVFRDTLEQMPDTFLGLVPMLMFGSGMAAYHHIKAEDHARIMENFSYAGLAKMGLGPEAIANVQSKLGTSALAPTLGMELLRRDPATMSAENTRNAETTAAATTTVATALSQPWAPTMAPEDTKAGREWVVKNPDGTEVLRTQSKESADETFAQHYAAAEQQHLLSETERMKAEAEQVRATAAEEHHALLPAGEQTTATNLFEVTPTAPAPGSAHEARISDLNAALQSRYPGAGVGAVEVNALSRAGKAMKSLLQHLINYTGVGVSYVASTTDQELPFNGVVLGKHPNTIFLDAEGNRNMLSVFGHEWSHTLEKNNPALWQEMHDKLRPLVKDWAVMTGKLPSIYASLGELGKTQENIANMVGDAFAHPEFWRMVEAKDKGLFRKILDAINEWFDGLKEHVSAHGTEEDVTNLEKVHEAILHTLTASYSVPSVSITGGPSGAQFAARVAKPGELNYVEPSERHGRSAVEEYKSARKWAVLRAATAAYQRAVSSGRVVAGLRGPGEGGPGQPEVLGPGTDRLAVDPRIVEKVGADWPHGFDEWGFPNLPQPDIPPGMADDTLGKVVAFIPQSLADDLGIPAGDVSRETLRNAIAEYFLGKGDISLGKRVMMSGGGGGSGKSTFLNKTVGKELKERFVHVDADAIKAFIPEYNALVEAGDLKAAGAVHEESSLIARDILSKAFERGLPVLFDGTIANIESAEAKVINPARKKGYDDIKLTGVIIDPYEAAVRSVLRYFGSKRYVPLEMLWTAHEGFDNNFADGKYDAMIGADNASYFDNTAVKPAQGEFQMSARREDYKFTNRGERELLQEGYITPEEEQGLPQWIEARITKEGVPAGWTKEEFTAEVRRQIHADILSKRKEFPDHDVNDPWAPAVFTGAKWTASVNDKGERKLKAEPMTQAQPYTFDQVPAGQSRAGRADEMADKITGEFVARMQRGGPNAKKILDALEWYRGFVGLLTREYGGFRDLIADLLGAFSPRQNVRLNWFQAVEAGWVISSGKYDREFSKLSEFLYSGGTVNEWRAQGGWTMRARNGALFGTNTNLGMEAAVNLWREIKKGDAPKAKNFTRNLIYLSIKATIDVWAARQLQRIADRPRIPLHAETAVQGEHVTPTEIKGQFAFGQEVFQAVADKMKDPKTWKGTGIDGAQFANITAADVQAINWFVEKEVWTENDWTNEQGAEGSMILELKSMYGERFVSGFAPKSSTVQPVNPAQEKYARNVRRDLIAKLPRLIVARAMDTIGILGGTPHRTLDTEITHGPDMEPNDLMRVVLNNAQKEGLEYAWVGRVINDHEDNPNARPGMEVYFREPLTQEQMAPIWQYLKSSGLDGFTAAVDIRTKAAERGPDSFVGIRFQWIPELMENARFSAEEAQAVEAKIQNLMETTGKLPGVAMAQMLQYDTIVFRKGVHYDSGAVDSTAISTGESAAWRARFFDQAASRAVAEYGEEAGGDAHREPVPDQRTGISEGAIEGWLPEGRGEAGRKPAAVDITVYDMQAREFTTESRVPDKELLSELKQEERDLNKLMECLNL